MPDRDKVIAAASDALAEAVRPLTARELADAAVRLTAAAAARMAVDEDNEAAAGLLAETRDLVEALRADYRDIARRDFGENS